MIDENQMNAALAEHNERRARQAIANAANQRAIFDALSALAIVRLEIEFDGYGDSGQLEQATVTGGGGALSGDVVRQIALYNGTNETGLRPLAEAVNDLCCDLLDCGWQDNEGAFGTFVFDVATRRIELEFNSRYTSHDTSVRTFTEA
jgi:hypothetical protein